MIDPTHRTLAQVAAALRQRQISAGELAEGAIRRHAATDSSGHAYKRFDAEAARERARQADERIASDPEPPPFCGIPVSVKDLYGTEGFTTFAGTARRLPEKWERDAWLVRRLRDQGAVFMGKTHTVELAFGAVGINPHWDTPRNPWDADSHRIPGGSSCGAGVSLCAGSALLALGSDTGGSIRIPAAITGTVGHKITHGRWPATGVVPLSTTLDTVGGLTRSVQDAAFFFGAIDPACEGAHRFLEEIGRAESSNARIAVPQCGIWSECQTDIAEVLQDALDELGAAGWERSVIDGSLIDAAGDLYMSGGIVAAECVASLEGQLPGWREILHPIVGDRLEGAPSLDSERYSRALMERDGLMARAGRLFETADVLALPTATITPPIVSDLDDPSRYGKANAALLRPTCPISMLGLCAITIPVGLDQAGMPVGLQLVAGGGRDERLLGAALAAERVLGSARNRLGETPAAVTS